MAEYIDAFVTIIYVIGGLLIIFIISFVTSRITTIIGGPSASWSDIFKPNIKKLKAKGDVKGLIKALRMNWELGREPQNALVQIGLPAVQPLIAALKDNHKGVGMTAALILGEIGDARAVESLITALKDKNNNVGPNAAEALGKIGDKRAVEPLIAALKDENVRPAAAKALGRIGDVRSVEPLIASLGGNGLAAVEALRQFGDSAVEPLIAGLRNENEHVRKLAAMMLGEFGDTRALESLIAELNQLSANTEITNMMKMVRRIGSATAMEPLIAALKDENKYVRSNVAIILGMIGDTKAVDPLITALNDDDWYVRSTVAETLGKIGDARAVEPLIAALNDDGGIGSVWSKAAWALNKIGWLPTKDESGANYWIGREYWEGAIQLGPYAIQPLLRVAQKYSDKSSYAVNALKTIVSYDTAGISIKDLQALSTLTDVKSTWDETDHDGALAGHGEKLLDCSMLRELAQRELALRE
jgi:HEAT repeat protein